jgi:glycolate oxidase
MEPTRPTAADLEELRALLGANGVLDSEAARFTYEADALTLERAMPDVVVLPRSTDEVSAVVRWAAARGVPVTPRGAGTGLAGGATAWTACSAWIPSGCSRGSSPGS